LSNRSLFLSAVLLGLVATLPTWARAKGQWCNDEQVLYEADMTLDAATVGGEPTAAPEGIAFRLQTTATGELNAVVFCPECETSVVPHEQLRRAP
jgi:hypothetical protein